MQLFHAADTDHIRTGALDIGSHTVQEIGHIYYMRLPGTVLNDRIPVRHGCRHHNVDGSSDGYCIQINVAASQLFRLCADSAVADADSGSQRFKSFQMKVNGSAADITSARQRNFCLLIFSQQSPQQVIGRPDLLYIFIINADFTDPGSVQQYCMACQTLHPNTNLRHGLQHNINITYIRQVFY